ncbi:uncharacterized protein MYCFIDRAFT_175908 [Pseudocercospora fijiensis CIRAD86]|uniref:F-box domain-containing protein n=1 Tax=Pseudocercospora fijiensis (strain CIRAD86) TaxID=383855 RepID=M3ACU4_PSEFD|nr:uncharacterized protein MYCFIDRAFT_175908 [Pseudocercospora fijiensis CIRAD86]EME82371.1 hypothetical protein MYCFIDRAFT_175908 [Pseudocercospora fijiensis CIRAD86]
MKIKRLSSSRPIDPRNYWHLKVPGSVAELKASLDSQGMSYVKSSNKATLTDIHIRNQCGFSDYQKCDIDELRNFCTSRGLLPLPELEGKNKRQRKKLLGQHLQDADDNSTFNRFMDLPPELRVNIYEFYFHDLQAKFKPFDWSPDIPKTQPPITTPSRLVRKESLSVFYDLLTFKFTPRPKLSEIERRFLELAPQSVLDEVCNIQMTRHIIFDYFADDPVTGDQMGRRWGADWTLLISPGNMNLRMTGMLEIKEGDFGVVDELGDDDLDDATKIRADVVMQNRLAAFLEKRDYDGMRFRLVSDDVRNIRELFEDVGGYEWHGGLPSETEWDSDENGNLNKTTHRYSHSPYLHSLRLFRSIKAPHSKPADSLLDRVKNLEIILPTMVEVEQYDASSYFDGEIYWKIPVVNGRMSDHLLALLKELLEDTYSLTYDCGGRNSWCYGLRTSELPDLFMEFYEDPAEMAAIEQEEEDPIYEQGVDLNIATRLNAQPAAPAVRHIHSPFRYLTESSFPNLRLTPPLTPAITIPSPWNQNQIWQRCPPNCKSKLQNYSGKVKTCAHFAPLLEHLFAERFFQRRSHLYTVHGLEALRDISRKAVFARHIKHVELVVVDIDNQDEAFEEDIESRTGVHLAATAEAERRYRAEQMRRQRYDYSLLYQALKAFKQLGVAKDIKVTANLWMHEPPALPINARRIHVEKKMQESRGGVFGVKAFLQSDICAGTIDEAVESLLLALARSHHTIDTLDLGFRSSDVLQDSFLPFHHLEIPEEIDRVWQIFRQLKKSRRGFTENPRGWGENRDAPMRHPSRRTLNKHGWQRRYTRSLNRFFAREIGASNIKRFALTDSHATEADIIALLSRYKHSLEALHFTNIALGSGYEWPPLLRWIHDEFPQLQSFSASDLLVAQNDIPVNIYATWRLPNHHTAFATDLWLAQYSAYFLWALIFLGGGMGRASSRFSRPEDEQRSMAPRFALGMGAERWQDDLFSLQPPQSGFHRLSSFHGNRNHVSGMRTTELGLTEYFLELLPERVRCMWLFLVNFDGSEASLTGMRMDREADDLCRPPLDDLDRLLNQEGIIHRMTQRSLLVAKMWNEMIAYALSFAIHTYNTKDIETAPPRVSLSDTMATLDSLPAEMHVEVASYLDNASIIATRQVCRTLAKNSHDIFVERFFRRRAHVFTPESIAILRQISTSPLARHVRELELIAVHRNRRAGNDGRSIAVKSRLFTQIDSLTLIDGLKLVDIFQNFQRLDACRSIKVSSRNWFRIEPEECGYKETVIKMARSQGIFGMALLLRTLGPHLKKGDLEAQNAGSIFNMVNRDLALSKLEAHSLNFCHNQCETFPEEVYLDQTLCEPAWAHVRSLALGFAYCFGEDEELCQTIGKCSRLERLGLDRLRPGFVGPLAAALLATNISSISLLCMGGTEWQLCENVLIKLLPRLKVLRLEHIWLVEGSWKGVCRLLRKGGLKELTLGPMIHVAERWYFRAEAGHGPYHAEGLHEVDQLLVRLIEHGCHEWRSDDV